MRTLLQIELDTDISNRLITEGKMSAAMAKMMDALKPEAAYFYPRDGHRSMTLVVNLPDEASLVTTCEPFWLELGAFVQAFPCMNAEELTTGIGRLGYGS